MPVEIESLSYGPHAVARVEGKVCFVRHVAPGDVVEVEITEDRGSFAFGSPARVIQRGAAYREPPCPYLPNCGGCPWQHVIPEVQAAAKESVVRDLLHRIGQISNPPLSPILSPGPDLGYRRRLSLRAEDGVIGYFAGASHDLVPVSECLLAEPRLRGGIELAQRWVRPLQTHLKRVEIAASGEGDRLVLSAQAEGSFAAADAALVERFLSGAPRIAGAAIWGRGWRHSWGVDRIDLPLLGGDALELHAGTFSQVNEAANRLLIETVLENAAVEPTHEVVDLFAGAGNLSLPLARHAAEVTAVESSVAAIADGRASAHRLGLSNVSFLHGDAARALRDWARRGRRFDTVVLDPPRSGAAATIDDLLRLQSARIVYVSCDPATLARDLKRLIRRYRLERVQPIDFFPQTYHVETVSLLMLAGS